MDLFPAMDLLDGRCVRLRQGRFQDSKSYSEDPLGVLQGFERAGARHAHIVDLNGARDPESRQRTLLRSLISRTSLKIQCGGGVRTLSDVHELLDCGADRVVLGSVAILMPKLAVDALREFGPERITLALDVMTGADGRFRVATHGWQASSHETIGDILSRFTGEGPLQVLCTDVRRDGMLEGPNLELYRALTVLFPEVAFQASGGICSLPDLKALQELGACAAVIGKALYEGRFGLREAISEC